MAQRFRVRQAVMVKLRYGSALTRMESQDLSGLESSFVSSRVPVYRVGERQEWLVPFLHAAFRKCPVGSEMRRSERQARQVTSRIGVE
jgi:hypothetical protein